MFAYNSSLGLEMLTNGSWSASIGYLYNSTMEYWFWLILMVSVLIMLYISTQSETFVAIGGLIMSAALLFLLPAAARPILYLILVISIGIMIYKSIKQ